MLNSGRFDHAGGVAGIEIWRPAERTDPCITRNATDHVVTVQCLKPDGPLDRELVVYSGDTDGIAPGWEFESSFPVSPDGTRFALGRKAGAIEQYERALQGLPPDHESRKVAQERLDALKGGIQ